MGKHLRLITESSTSIDAKKSGKKLFIQGIFQEVDTKNQNGRLYPRALLEKHVSKLQPRIARKALFGQLGHPTDPSGDPSKISHRIDQLWWNGNKLMGKARILGTSAGHDLQAIIEAGSQIMISSRSVGIFDPDTGVVESDGFKLITFDIVEQGGVADAYVKGVYENRTWSPCQISQMFEQEKPNEKAECDCSRCGKIATIPRGKCRDYHCSYCNYPSLRPYGKQHEQKVFKESMGVWIDNIRDREIL
jgi:hypothetical protein